MTDSMPESCNQCSSTFRSVPLARREKDDPHDLADLCRDDLDRNRYSVSNLPLVRLACISHPAPLAKVSSEATKGFHN